MLQENSVRNITRCALIEDGAWSGWEDREEVSTRLEASRVSTGRLVQYSIVTVTVSKCFLSYI